MSTAGPLSALYRVTTTNTPYTDDLAIIMVSPQAILERYLPLPLQAAWALNLSFLALFFSLIVAKLTLLFVWSVTDTLALQPRWLGSMDRLTNSTLVGITGEPAIRFRAIMF